MSILVNKIQRLYDFMAGTPAKSSEVDNEFNQIIDALNTTVDDLNNIQTQTTTNSENITDLAGEGRTVENIKQTYDEFTEHANNTNNPHQLTAEQLNSYTKDELLPYLISGDTEIRYDVFTIVNADNGDGTFTYTDGIENITGILTVDGFQNFILRNGMYKVGADRIEAWVNDTLHRSVASGGLIEVGDNNSDSYEIILTLPIGNDSEVTFKYYERIGMAGKHGIAHSPSGSDAIISIGAQEPIELHEGKMFFRILGER